MSIENYEKLATNLEKTTIETIQKENVLLRQVLIALFAISILSVLAALVAIFFRKEPEPQVVALNVNTGDVIMMRSLKDAVDQYGETVDTYWLSKYVETYEQYDWFTLGSDVETIKLMSIPAVFGEYDQKVRAESSPLNRLKDTGRIKVSIVGVSFANELAFVRFTTEKLDPSGRNIDGSPIQSWMATIAYTYDTEEKLTSSQRRTNPLSLKVQSYKVRAETK